MRIASVTVGRSDTGIYRPVWREILARNEFDLAIIAGAAHLEDRFGQTVEDIQADGFKIAAKVPMLEPGDLPLDIARSYARGVEGFAQAFAKIQPDIALLLGDRFEMHAAACAAVLLRIPIAHIHGGEESQGATDNLWRHSITKLANLHFASTEGHAARIRQMGEDPARVIVSGAPALDEILSGEEPPLTALQARVPGLESQFLLVTLHPATATDENPGDTALILRQAILETGHHALWTMPNADSGGKQIRMELEANRSPQIYLVENLGPDLYRTAMRHSLAMVGNSSSGIIEAASFGLPVVDVGDRQAGRERAENVIAARADKQSVILAINRATSEGFRSKIRDVVNPYGTGTASKIIAETLGRWNYQGMPSIKRFQRTSD